MSMAGPSGGPMKRDHVEYVNRDSAAVPFVAPLFKNFQVSSLCRDVFAAEIRS